jgi:hypothetical protein
MLAQLKHIFALGTFTLALGAFAVTPATAQTRTFKVVNESHYTIERIYVSPATYTRWGFDRLGDNALLPGYEFTLSIIPGYYDVKLVDEDGDSCVVKGLDFRSGDRWTLNDGVLLACELVTSL